MMVEVITMIMVVKWIQDGGKEMLVCQLSRSSCSTGNSGSMVVEQWWWSISWI